MKRTLRLLSTLSVTAVASVGCERSTKYAAPPVSSYSIDRFTLGTEPADTVAGAMVSPEFFAASSVRPLLGRFFLPIEYESSAAKPVAVLSDALWRRRFKGAPQVIGTQIQLNGRAVFVVGVAPPEFRWPTDAAIWLPRVAR